MLPPLSIFCHKIALSTLVGFKLTREYFTSIALHCHGRTLTRLLQLCIQVQLLHVWQIQERVLLNFRMSLVGCLRLELSSSVLCGAVVLLIIPSSCTDAGAVKEEIPIMVIMDTLQMDAILSKSDQRTRQVTGMRLGRRLHQPNTTTPKTGVVWRWAH